MLRDKATKKVSVSLSVVSASCWNWGMEMKWEREGKEEGKRGKGINWVEAWSWGRRERMGKAAGSGRFYWGISWKVNN